MDKNLQKQIDFNKKLHKLLEETQRVKPFNYDSVFTKNNEYKKHNTLFQVRLKALSMEKIDAKIWWDVVYDIIQKDIGKICRRYEKNESCTSIRYFKWRSCMPSFEYEPFIFSP
jgi:hypothetical protein